MVINENANSNKTLAAYKAAAALLPIPSASVTSSAGVGVSSSVPLGSSSTTVMTSMVPTSIPTTVPTSTTTSGPTTFTGAANREVVGTSGFAGVLFAALAFVL
jgi:hypothetical protein